MDDNASPHRAQMMDERLHSENIQRLEWPATSPEHVWVVLRGRAFAARRNEKVSNHGSIPITIDCNVVAFIVFEEGFHQPIKRTKQSVFLDVTVIRHTLVD
ncbi:hypothetical protein TNCV_4246941 [Trichonephila clavipes]|nr:hypothetical protein TNCV_4246941 [Trichonephila clavipes]